MATRERERERERDLELLIRERERDLELLIPVSSPENAAPKSSTSLPESPASTTTSTHSHHSSGREVSRTSLFDLDHIMQNII
jgi:hypothetical protein